MKRSGCNQITAEHILAADRLRSDADLADLGYSAGRDLSVPPPAIARPRSGPGAAAIAQARADDSTRRAFARFTHGQQAMLVVLVLQNHSLPAWCEQRAIETGRRCDAKTELGKLIALLDITAEHYASEIERDVALGRVLMPE